MSLFIYIILKWFPPRVLTKEGAIWSGHGICTYMWGGIWGRYSLCGAPDSESETSRWMFQHLLSILRADGDFHSRRAQTMGHEPCATHSGEVHWHWWVPLSLSLLSRQKHNSQGQFRGSVPSPRMPQSTRARRACPSYSPKPLLWCLSSKPYLKATDRVAMVRKPCFHR